VTPPTGDPGGFSGAFSLEDRVAVVTGGGSGIGRAIALTLSGAGAAVAVGDINDGWGEATCDLVREAGGRAVFEHADVARAGDYRSLVERAASDFGGVDILCNLGGPPAPFVDLCDLTEDQLDTVLSTHLKSIVWGCQAAVPHMSAERGGAIVNMASTAADKPSAGNGLYNLAKSGVISLTRVLALELGPRNIRVNAIAPGATLTNFSRRYFTDEDGQIDERRRDQWLQQMAGLSPLGITGTPEDQAWLVLYLVSQASRFVTGQVVRANGGWSMP
jgi:3-oxoacyl-[acyl-carrier protein] reductase